MKSKNKEVKEKRCLMLGISSDFTPAGPEEDGLAISYHPLHSQSKVLNYQLYVSFSVSHSYGRKSEPSVVSCTPF
jgi:hypothetical protein